MAQYYQETGEPDYHDHSSDRNDDDSSSLETSLGRRRTFSFSDAEEILAAATSHYQSFTMSNSPVPKNNGLHHRSHNRRQNPDLEMEGDGHRQLRSQRNVSRLRRYPTNIKKNNVAMLIFTIAVCLYMLLILRTMYWMLQNSDYSSLFSTNDAKAILPIRQQSQQGYETIEFPKRSLERLERSRPPQLFTEKQSNLQWYTMERTDHRFLMEQELSSNETLASMDQLCGSLAQSAALKEPQSFFSKSALNSKAVVLVTGILNPVGFSVALQLKEQCGVQKVIGIDNMFPNTIANRIELQERMQLLTTTFPKMPKPIILPHIGLDPKYKKGTSFHESPKKEFNLMGLKPTHVLHLSSYSKDVYSDAQVDPEWRNTRSPYVEEDGENQSHLYQLSNSMVSMEQILASIINGTEPPQFVYASSLTRDNSDPVHSTTKIIDELLADTYHSISGPTSVGLRFPNAIYGPWGQRGSIVHDIMQMTVEHWNDTNSDEIELSMNENDEDMLDLLYVDDAVEAIIGALQYQTTRPLTLDITSGAEITQTSFANSLKSFVPGMETSGQSIFDKPLLVNTRRIENKGFLDWEPLTSLRDGVLKTLAWHLDRASPFGPSFETGDEFLQRYDHDTCAPDDLVCHKGYHYLPCSSECNIKEQCVPSVFDNVVDLVQNTTEGCNLILYTQSLGDNVNDLHLHPEYMDETELNEDDLLLCNLAFVPRDSDLVEKVTNKVPEDQLVKFGIKPMKSESKKAFRERILSGLNGRLLYRGWILIWVEDAIESLSVTDRSMLKLSPGKLFAPDVQKVLFMEENYPKSPHIEDILFWAEELERSAQGVRTVQKKMENDGVIKRMKYQLPSEPQRRAGILFAPLRYPNVDDPTVKKYRNGEKKLTILDATKFMRYEAGLGYQGKEPQNIRRQREFYERIPSYVNREKELRSDFEPYYRYAMRHWVRKGWVIHDVTLEESRLLRCEWYREHVQWGAEIDPLSFAHIMALREVKRRIAHNEPDDHIKTFIEKYPILRPFTDSYEWHGMQTEANKLYPEPVNWVAELMGNRPISTPQDDKQIELEQGHLVPLFIRIISERTMNASKKRWMKRQKALKKQDPKKQE
jgi:hypothetical protein